MKDHLFLQKYAISKQNREKLNGHYAFTIWMTGLSGSGKTTLASKTDEWLHQKGVKSYVLDGDNTRLGINKDLDFTNEGRKENSRRIAEICKLFNDAGIVVIASFIAPFIEDRILASEIIGKDSFNEIFIDADLETCIKRDTKGLYKLALNGEVSNFTGINSPYEKPISPDLQVKTDCQTIDDSALAIKNWLNKNKLVLNNI